MPNLRKPEIKTRLLLPYYHVTTGTSSTVVLVSTSTSSGEEPPGKSVVRDPRVTIKRIETSSAETAWLELLINRSEGFPKLGVPLGQYWGYIGIMEDKMETTILGLGFPLIWGTIFESICGFRV